ncbi:MAG: UDP-N-acetylglucosamine 2-epimerase (non-hydrolyzing), partial [Candidatus Thorarchaeota archaeon]|nr:UDP-N-acetylglucosamine 2-epimerase (non-hydrolyzing) [Candidatus Thorarchaeota archaeon]
MKPFFVIGTRPEIIKMTPIIHECERRNIELFLLHTGQHYSESLSSQFFDDMGLRDPDMNLNIGSGTHSEQTAKALVGIEKALVKEKPDIVLVQGDTNAVLSAALAAAKLGIPVGHVEAGLRSYDIRMPEEHNRRLTDHVSSYLFAPTQKSADILKSEQVWGEIFITGNTVIDALESRLPLIQNRKTVADQLDLDEFVLLTMHRAENVDDKKILTGLLAGIQSLESDIIFAAHPRTVARLNEFGLMSEIKEDNRIHIVEPPGYLDFIALMKKCNFILTDSGGIQEEATAPSINKS